MRTESTAELGRRLRARRTAAGRTIASVAVEAGLSVPYIANLENGRGNPTVAALAALAEALGARLAVELVADDAPVEPVALPETLVAYARTARFAAEAGRLAEAGGTALLDQRQKLLGAMAAVAATADRPLGELDWHRILDAIILINRS
ncbi:transcriptional regulator with XRE-family HTH domain [Allocatelliglobosispora scoriae]|uniref:Transcriptional regulator with XRE-family HTH domain n=1 Tax=Allocatelliglobosispora scoriae TaxID=643052 RepID=A0A841BPE9_9ACTN|nr:helix-turn-helix domain-containing protein [Allocatelliglobosispora scoriae]MBB5868690.1 transcriptional regulator with XRE-family HTH domain [Allocatelliglobosispora scoriae]